MKKRTTEPPKFPAATIAFYGPDNKRASKVVVAIIASETAAPEPVQKWVSGLVDVRANENIGNQIESFLKENRVNQVIVTDGIIGCPHEAGENYPAGMNCPLCAFWSNRNRFTHEIENEEKYPQSGRDSGGRRT
jgi:hypothetical protein